MEGADARYKDLVDLVFARPAEHHGLPADRFETRMPRVLVRDRDDGGLGLRDGVTRFGVWRVRQHDAFPPAHAKTSVAEPGQVHGVGREYAKRRVGLSLMALLDEALTIGFLQGAKHGESWAEESER